MNLIGREELKAKLDRGDGFKLAMTLGGSAFNMAHIPGSLNVNSMEQAQRLVSPDDEIVVYCHDESCPASKAAYQMLVSHGFTNVRRYAGGMRDWQEAGYPLERDPELVEDAVRTTALSQPITEEDHIQGRTGAPVTLVVYGDYECPYTRRTMTHVKGLQRRLSDELCFVYRHFPAPPEIHPHAWLAAEAALAADAQGKFWEMHEHLFRHQKALDSEHLEVYAAEMEFNVARFKHELHEHIHDARIQRDRDSGWKSGAREVPTLFINNVRYQGELKLASIMDAIKHGRGFQSRPG